jgi:hypothetical protein
MPHEFIRREYEPEPQASGGRSGVPPGKHTAAGVLDPPFRPKNPLRPIPAILALIACGMISILLSRSFRSIQGVVPGAKIHWSLFSTALMLIGGLTVVIALLPSLWLERACNSGPHTKDRSSMPTKLLGGFALFSYLLVIGLNFAPPSWHPSAQVVYLVCPACVLTITVDPSFGTVALLLAPLSAAVYGSLGALVGYFFLAIRNRI